MVEHLASRDIENNWIFDLQGILAVNSFSYRQLWNVEVVYNSLIDKMVSKATMAKILLIFSGFLELLIIKNIKKTSLKSYLNFRCLKV